MKVKDFKELKRLKKTVPDHLRGQFEGYMKRYADYDMLNPEYNRELLEELFMMGVEAGRNIEKGYADFDVHPGAPHDD